jgi:hypothetical protein
VGNTRGLHVTCDDCRPHVFGEAHQEFGARARVIRPGIASGTTFRGVSTTAGSRAGKRTAKAPRAPRNREIGGEDVGADLATPLWRPWCLGGFSADPGQRPAVVLGVAIRMLTSGSASKNLREPRRSLP